MDFSDKKDSEILFSSIIGIEFEFFSNFGIEETKESLVQLLGKKILVFTKSHSEFTPSYDVYKMEPDFSGGEKLIELITGPLPYQEARLTIIKVLKWISENGRTSDRSSIHINISFEKKKVGDTFLSHMNVLKFILDFDEEKVFQAFPNRKDSVYAKSIKYIVPSSKYYIDDVNDLTIIPGNFLFPQTKYYGINFSKLIKNYLEFRYLGGKDYEKRGEEILNFMNFFIISLYKSNAKKSYTYKNKQDLKKILNNHKNILNAYRNYDDYKKIFTEIKILVDLKEDRNYVYPFYDKIKDRIYYILTETNIKKGLINYNSDTGKIQIKDAEITNCYDLCGFEVIDCTLRGNISDCDLFRCVISDSDIQDCNLFYSTEVKGSKLKNSYVNRSGKLENCYVFGKKGVMNGYMEGGIFREGKVTQVTRFSDTTEVIEMEKIK